MNQQQQKIRLKIAVFLFNESMINNEVLIMTMTLLPRAKCKAFIAVIFFAVCKTCLVTPVSWKNGPGRTPVLCDQTHGQMPKILTEVYWGLIWDNAGRKTLTASAASKSILPPVCMASVMPRSLGRRSSRVGASEKN